MEQNASEREKTDVYVPAELAQFINHVLQKGIVHDILSLRVCHQRWKYIYQDLCHKIPIPLYDVLELNEETMTVRVEPTVTVGDITRYLIPKGELWIAGLLSRLIEVYLFYLFRSNTRRLHFGRHLGNC